jgi:hypothetical protein
MCAIIIRYNFYLAKQLPSSFSFDCQVEILRHTTLLIHQLQPIDFGASGAELRGYPMIIPVIFHPSFKMKHFNNIISGVLPVLTVAG